MDANESRPYENLSAEELDKMLNSDEPQPGAGAAGEDGEGAGAGSGEGGEGGGAAAAASEIVVDDKTKFENAEAFEKELGTISGDLPAFAKTDLNKQIEAAKASGDWKPLVPIFQELKGRAKPADDKGGAGGGKGGAAPAAQLTPEQIEAEKKANREKYDTFVRQEVQRSILQTDVFRDMQELGLDLPQNKADWDLLKKENYALFTRLEDALKGARAEVVGVLQRMDKASDAAEQALAAGKKAGEELLNAWNEKYELGLKPEEIKKLVDAAAADERSFRSDDDGILHPLDNFVKNHVLLTMNDKLLEHVELKGKITGATTTGEQIKDLRRRALKGISNATIPGQAPAKPKENLSAEDIKGLSNDELDKRLERAVSN